MSWAEVKVLKDEIEQLKKPGVVQQIVETNELNLPISSKVSNIQSMYPFVYNNELYLYFSSNLDIMTAGDFYKLDNATMEWSYVMNYSVTGASKFIEYHNKLYIFAGWKYYIYDGTNIESYGSDKYGLMSIIDSLMDVCVHNDSIFILSGTNNSNICIYEFDGENTFSLYSVFPYSVTNYNYSKIVSYDNDLYVLTYSGNFKYIINDDSWGKIGGSVATASTNVFVYKGKIHFFNSGSHYCLVKGNSILCKTLDIPSGSKGVLYNNKIYFLGCNYSSSNATYLSNRVVYYNGDKQGQETGYISPRYNKSLISTIDSNCGFGENAYYYIRQAYPDSLIYKYNLINNSYDYLCRLNTTSYTKCIEMDGKVWVCPPYSTYTSTNSYTFYSYDLTTGETSSVIATYQTNINISLWFKFKYGNREYIYGLGYGGTFRFDGSTTITRVTDKPDSAWADSSTARIRLKPYYDSDNSYVYFANNITQTSQSYYRYIWRFNGATWSNLTRPSQSDSSTTNTSTSLYSFNGDVICKVYNNDYYKISGTSFTAYTPSKELLLLWRYANTDQIYDKNSGVTYGTTDDKSTTIFMYDDTHGLRCNNKYLNYRTADYFYNNNKYFPLDNKWFEYDSLTNYWNLMDLNYPNDYPTNANVGMVGNIMYVYNQSKCVLYNIDTTEFTSYDFPSNISISTTNKVTVLEYSGAIHLISKEGSSNGYHFAMKNGTITDYSSEFNSITRPTSDNNYCVFFVDNGRLNFISIYQIGSPVPNVYNTCNLFYAYFDTNWHEIGWNKVTVPYVNDFTNYSTNGYSRCIMNPVMSINEDNYVLYSWYEYYNSSNYYYAYSYIKLLKLVYNENDYYEFEDSNIIPNEKVYEATQSGYYYHAFALDVIYNNHELNVYGDDRFPATGYHYIINPLISNGNRILGINDDRSLSFEHIYTTKMNLSTGNIVRCTTIKNISGDVTLQEDGTYLVNSDCDVTVIALSPVTVLC